MVLTRVQDVRPSAVPLNSNTFTMMTMKIRFWHLSVLQKKSLCWTERAVTRRGGDYRSTLNSLVRS